MTVSKNFDRNGIIAENIGNTVRLVDKNGSICYLPEISSELNDSTLTALIDLIYNQGWNDKVEQIKSADMHYRMIVYGKKS